MGVTQNRGTGALPTLRAATAPDVHNGQYYGSDSIGEQRGHPKVVESSTQSHNTDIQRRLRIRAIVGAQSVDRTAP